MDLSVSRSQIGLLLTVFGTAALAFSVRTKSQYAGETAKAVKKAKSKNSHLFVPTETYIVRPLFWGGLGIIALGALLQW
jgi:hypothetical protein